MSTLQATWTPEGHLFFWSTGPTLDQAVSAELPDLQYVEGSLTHRSLAQPGQAMRRKRTPGLETTLHQALPVLASLPVDEPVSDSIKCWSAAAKLGLRLAAAQRVVPTVAQGRARWRALFTRSEDRARLDAVVRALPTASRSLPTHQRGKVKLFTPDHVVRAFVDGTIDWSITEYPTVSIEPFGGRWVVAPLNGKAQIKARQVDLFTGAVTELNAIHDFSFTTRLDVDAETVKVTPLLSY